MAQSNITWINEVPEYSSLPACAASRLSVIVRDMSSGCGLPTSYGCFCSASYSNMNTVIAAAVYSDCQDGADANSAVEVFADYCSSTPMITIPVAQATAITTPTASPLIIVSSATPSSTVSSESTTLSTSVRSNSQSAPSSSASSLSQLPTASTDENYQTSSPDTPSTGGFVGIGVGIFFFIFIMACVIIWMCRRRARKNNVQARSSLLQGSTHRGGSRLAELSASEVTPLLEKALEHKETKPKTNTTVADERSKLLEVISLLNNHKETPENSQKIFDCLKGLIENLQDQQAVSQVPYDVDFALFHCNELAKISKRIHQKRPGAPTVAHFYKGQVLFTHARLQELGQLAQATSSTAESLFENAFREFAAVKQVSDRLQKPLDVETQKYRGRSLYACAFILAKFPKFARMEPKLVKNQEYLAAGAEMLETARHQGDLVEAMIKLDEELIRRLAA